MAVDTPAACSHVRTQQSPMTALDTERKWLELTIRDLCNHGWQSVAILYALMAFTAIFDGSHYLHLSFVTHRSKDVLWSVKSYFL